MATYVLLELSNICLKHGIHYDLVLKYLPTWENKKKSF